MVYTYPRTAEKRQKFKIDNSLMETAFNNKKE